MRPSRENEILTFLSLRREGFAWRELVGEHVWTQSEVFTGKVTHGKMTFPRQTLDKHLKALIKKGLVERVLEPREERKRGRQCTQYRIPARFWESWGCLHSSFPVKRVGSTWFVGQVIGDGVKQHVRVIPQEQERFRSYKAWLRSRKNPRIA